MNIINNSSKPVLIISGDRHIGALYEKDGIFEITSSSLNKPISPIKLKLQKEETDPLMIGKVFKKENYGVLEVNAQERSILFGLKDINGRTINEEKIILKWVNKYMSALGIVFPDQLSESNPVLKSIKEDDNLLFYEPLDTFYEIAHHKQKLVFLISSLRHFKNNINHKNVIHKN